MSPRLCRTFIMETKEETMGNSLAEGIVKQQSRCRELLKAYVEIGPAGQFGHAMISDVLSRTEKAVMEGDTIAMISLYKELEACE